jgi:predicted adenine nucleotide alpha hydrolase (AANH) superfamily ATPase
MCAISGIDFVCRDDYALEQFLAAVAAHPDLRCHYCYFSRLDETARKAAELGFDAFTTSLLYSRYQNHDHIIAAAERAAERNGITFHYEDFRPGWQEGIRLSKEMGLYRQQYCGCIYSEKERYLSKV